MCLFQKKRIFWLLTVTSRITNLKLLQTLEQSQTCSICSVFPFITPKKGTPKRGYFFSFSSPQRKGEIKYPPRDRPIAIFKLIWESPKFTPKESQISFTHRFTSLSSSPLRVSPSPKSRKEKENCLVQITFTPPTQRDQNHQQLGPQPRENKINTGAAKHTPFCIANYNRMKPPRTKAEGTSGKCWGGKRGLEWEKR